MSEDNKLLDHAYDEIQEYDNPLPGWWSAIFWATIAFSAVYVVVFHVGDWVKTPEARYEAARADYAAQKTARDIAEASSIDEQALARRAADPQIVSMGRSVFVSRCASCHTEDGRGLIGPNLTDHFQIHGDSRVHIYNTVRRGVPGTAMLAWGEQLPPNDVVAVTAFVVTLRGQNLAGKGREGQPVQQFVP